MFRTPLLACLVVAALTLGACDGGEVDPLQPTSTGAETTVAGDGDRAAAMMAAAVEQLIAEDHTFGDGPPPFSEYLLMDRLDPQAGHAGSAGTDQQRPLTTAEQAAIESVVIPFGPVRWIADPAAWRTADLMPLIENSVIVGVGEPEILGDTALVPVSLWCGGLCGTWLTYRIELVGGEWTVTGTEGPITIS